MVLKLGSASDKRRAREASARRVRKSLGTPGEKRASEATIRKVTTSEARDGGGGGGKRTTTVVIGEAQNVPGAPKLGTTVTTETLASGQTVQVTSEPGVTQEQIERAVTQGRADAGRSYRQSLVQQEVAQTRAGVFEQEVSQQLRSKGYLTKGEVEALGAKYNLTAEEKKSLQKEVGGARIVPGQYTPVSPLTSTFFQQTQLKQAPEPGTGTVRALTKEESVGLKASKFVSKITPEPFKKIDIEGGFKDSFLGDLTEKGRAIYTKATEPVAKAGAFAISFLPEGKAKQDITGFGQGIRSGAEIALVDYPLFFPTYSGFKFGLETLGSGGTNIAGIAGGVTKGIADRSTRAQTIGELATVGYLAPKGYAKIPRVKIQRGYQPALLGQSVAKAYRAEALTLRKAGVITREAPITIKNVDFTRFESTKGNKPAQEAIRETLIENPEYKLGGSIILEQTGVQIKRRPQDYDTYTDVPIPEVVKTFTDKFDARKVQYEVRYKKNPKTGKQDFSGIYIKTGKGRYKEAITIHNYSKMLLPTQQSVATVKQRLATGITVKSPEGITLVRPELIVRRKLEGGFETSRKGVAAERYSKDIPAGIQATTAIIERVRERAQTLPPPFKQVQQFRAGYAETYLAGYKKFLTAERVQPVPYRKLPKYSTLQRTSMALKNVDLPTFSTGRGKRGQVGRFQPMDYYAGIREVAPAFRIKSPIRFEKITPPKGRAGGFKEAVSTYYTSPRRGAPRRGGRYYTPPTSATSYRPSVPSTYSTYRVPRSYTPPYSAPTSYTSSYRAPTSYTPPYSPPTSYTPPYTPPTPSYPTSYTPPTTKYPQTFTPPPSTKPKGFLRGDTDDKRVKRKSLKLPKFRQPKAYIPTLRATVGGIKAPKKGAKTRRLTGLEERPLLF